MFDLKLSETSELYEVGSKRSRCSCTIFLKWVLKLFNKKKERKIIAILCILLK
jgi:hypothetical protein